MANDLNWTSHIRKLLRKTIASFSEKKLLSIYMSTKDHQTGLSTKSKIRNEVWC